MALKGTPINIGPTKQTLLEVPATLEASLHSLILSNSTATNRDVTLSYFNSSASAESTFLTTTVSGNSTFTLPKPVNMEAGDKIEASANGTGIVALVSSFQNSATPIAQGFNPLGSFTASTSYAVNDVVSFTDGNSYLSRASGNLANTPSSSPSSWQVLAQKGNTGAVASITAGTGLTGGTINTNSATGTFAVDTTSISTKASALVFAMVFAK
jgi:hypothetical protein